MFMTLLLGIKFIVKPVMTTKESMAGVSVKKRIVQSAVSGIVVGFICGFVGAGGGMMMLLLITSVIGYEMKTGGLQPLCHRRDAGCGMSRFLRGVHPAVGESCGPVCK